MIITADEVRYLIKFFLASAYKKRKDKKQMIFSQKIFKFFFLTLNEIFTALFQKMLILHYMYIESTTYIIQK